MTSCCITSFNFIQNGIYFDEKLSLTINDHEIKEERLKSTRQRYVTLTEHEVTALTTSEGKQSILTEEY